MKTPHEKRESVWEYPRPPRLEPTQRKIRVLFAGTTIADSSRALRLLETSHPPTYYIPPGDVRMDLLKPTDHRSFCEFKGMTTYFSLEVGDRQSENCAWSYPSPVTAYAALRDHLAFFAGLVDECWVDEERAVAQPGGFYGGWITSDLEGPFKGAAGTLGW